MTIGIRFAARSDVGLLREGNEDSYLVDRRLELFAVADGMGGHRAGEIASATALDGLRDAVREGTEVADAVGRANTAVWDKAAGDTELAALVCSLFELPDVPPGFRQPDLSAPSEPTIVLRLRVESASELRRP